MAILTYAKGLKDHLGSPKVKQEFDLQLTEAPETLNRTSQLLISPVDHWSV